MARKRKTRIVTAARVLEVLNFAPDAGVFTWKYRQSINTTGKVAGVIDQNGYRKIKIDGVCYQAHYLVWLITRGVYPERTIAHLNGDRADNRPENLLIQQDHRDGLSQDALRAMLSYDPETGIFRWNIRRGRYAKVGQVAGHLEQDHGYVLIGINGECYRAHRLAWFYIFGEWPDGEIDHINGIRDDNRIENLRDVDDLRQAWNVGLRKANRTGKTGVSFDDSSGYYVAYLRVRGRQIYLGRYVSFSDAVKVRKAAELEHFGEFARAA